MNADGLAVYDESTNTLVQSFIVACQPGEGFLQAMFSADRSKLYILTVSHFRHYYFNVLDTSTNTFTGIIKSVPVISIGTDMWKHDYYGVTSVLPPTQFVQVDITNQSVVSSAALPPGAQALNAPVVDPSTGRAYVEDNEGPGGPGQPLIITTMKTFDPAIPNAFTASSSYYGGQAVLAASGAWLYFRGRFPDFYVGRMNTTTGAMQRIATDEQSGSADVGVTPDGARVFASDVDGVRSFDVATGNQLALIPAIGTNFAFGTKTNRLYLNGQTQIDVINPTSNSVVTTMPIPAGWPSTADIFMQIYSQ